jgi:hypothetical protein
MKRVLFLSICTLFLGVSCDKDIKETAAVRVEMKTIANGATIGINQSINHPLGYPYRISEFKVYLSYIRMVDQYGNVNEIKIDNYSGSDKQVFLYALGRNESFKGQVRLGTYKQIVFGLGLDPNTNNLNPNQFAATHPLSRNQDMYWDMTKYRFIVFEGFADTNSVGTFNHVFTYHIGGDQFFKEVTVNKEITIKDTEKTYTLPLELDINKLFNAEGTPIDIRTFFSFHSAGIDEDLGLKMIDNASKSFK